VGRLRRGAGRARPDPDLAEQALTPTQDPQFSRYGLA
jgi:hypothetical protein